MKLHIDRTACDGRGLCIELLPEVMDGDPWGYPRVLDGSRDPSIAPTLVEHARRAVEECPRRALHLVSD